MWMFCLCVMHLPGAYGGQKTDPLELEVQIASTVNHSLQPLAQHLRALVDLAKGWVLIPSAHAAAANHP